jgi:hypothetical protein
MSFPGEKRIELRIVFDNLDDYAEYQFVLLRPGWQDQVGGQEKFPGLRSKEIRFVGGGGYRMELLLFAVPRRLVAADGLVSRETLLSGTSDVLCSNPVQVTKTDSVLILWPFDYRECRIRTVLADGRLTLTPGPVEHFSNGFTSWVPALLTALVVTGLGVWLVRRLRRGRHAAAG